MLTAKHISVTLILTVLPYFCLPQQKESRHVSALLQQIDTCADPLECAELFDRTIDQAMTQEKKDSLIEAFIHIGKKQQEFNQVSSAVKTFSRGISVAEKEQLPILYHERLHMNLSIALRIMGAYTEAIEHRRITLQMQSRMNQEKGSHVLPLYYSNDALGQLFLQIEQFDSSLYYFQQALKITSRAGNSRRSASALNNMGYLQLLRQRCDSANHYFDSALYIYSGFEKWNQTDSFMVSLIHGNMAQCMDNANPLKPAYFKADIQRSLSYGNIRNAICSYNDYAMFLIETERFTMAEEALIKSEHLADQDSMMYADELLEVYDHFAALYILSNNPQKAIEYHQKQASFYDEIFGKRAKDQLISDHTSYRLSQIESELDLEQIKGEFKAEQIVSLNRKNRLANVKLWALIIIVALLILVTVLIVLRIMANAKQRAKEKEMSNRLLKLELDFNAQRLDQSTLSVNRKTEFAQELMSRINGMDQLDLQTKNSLKFYISNELEIDSSILEKEREVRQMGENQIARLREQFPNISENDIKLLGLIKMNLTNKQIAEIKKITLLSVKSAKNRLRKKLNLPPGASFDQVFDP